MKKVLIIEDNADVRDNMCDILSLAGYRAVSAPDGKAGVASARAERPDLILCDIMMAGLDGYGVLKILSGDPATAAIPFVFVTAKSEQEDLRRGMNLGADDYVTKPFYKDELLRIVEVRLRRAAMRTRKASVPEHWTGFLSKTALDEALDKLTAAGTVRRYRRGEALFRVGEKVRDLFLLVDGNVKLQKTTEFDKTLIVHVFRDRDFFGYPELIANRAYEHDAVALRDCEVRLIPAGEVRRTMTTDANVADLLHSLLASGLLTSDDRMLELSYFSVRKRCANTLLNAYAVFEDRPWPMSREELAQWSGTAKETFIRNLTDFRDAGYVEVDGAYVTLTNVRALRDVPY